MAPWAFSLRLYDADYCLGDAVQLKSWLPSGIWKEMWRRVNV